MKIEVDKNRKTVAFWLTREEGGSEEFRKSLAPYYRQCRENKYRAAMFLSGEGNLLTQTEGLLLHNQTLFAEWNIARERDKRQGGMGM